MNIKILSIMLILLTGCDDSKSFIKAPGNSYTFKTSDNRYYAITIIDGCQYLRFYNLHGDTFTHKGNCTNIIHRTNRTEL